jgi:hypothetical protein
MEAYLAKKFSVDVLIGGSSTYLMNVSSVDSDEDIFKNIK